MADNRDEIVRLVLEGENLLSDDIDKAVSQIDELSVEAKNLKAQLVKLENNDELINSFKKLDSTVANVTEELIQAKVKVSETGDALKAAGDDADNELRESFERAKLEVSSLSKELTKNKTALDKTEKSIKKAGLSAKDFDQQQADLSSQITETSSKIKSLNDQYLKAKETTSKQVLELEKETKARKEAIQNLGLEGPLRKAAVDSIEKQEAALRVITSQLEKEKVSLAVVQSAIEKEKKSRDESVKSIDSAIASLKEEKAELERNEQSIKKYANEFDSLSRARERGEITLKQFINSEKQLLSSLNLTESAVKKLKSETAAIAKEEERQAAQTKATNEAIEKKRKESENAEAAIKQYRTEIEKLVAEHKNEEITLRQLNTKEKELVAQLKLSGNEYKAIRREVEQVVAEEVRLAAASEKAAAAIKKEKDEAERIELAIKEYRDELSKLNAEKREGKITNGSYIDSEERLRKQLNLSSANVASAKKAIEADSKGKQSNLKNTDLLTQGTRRLAQAYTVLIAAQTAIQGIVGTIKDYGALEESITGVEKTTNAARSEMVGLAKELEGLSTLISGTATNDLLRYAEVAGQMGIRGSEALRDMAIAADALGVSTDLAGDEAIQALERINKITGESENGINGVASAVVALGNEFAASESDIVAFAKDLATGTTSAKLSSKAIFGIAAALKEIGLPQERTRSTFDRTFRFIESAVKKGGDAFVDLQKITGQTADELQENFGTRSEVIFVDFLKGLKGIQDGGGTTADVLANFGVTAGETIQTLGTMTGQIENIERGLRTADKAVTDGNAHLVEASKFWANQTSEINRAAAALTAFKARIGETLTDETQTSLDGFTQAFLENEEAITKVANAFTDMGIASLEGVGSIGNLLGAIGDATGGVSLLDIAIANVSRSFNAIEVVIDTMATGVAVLNLEIQTFFGATDEEIAKLEGRVDKSVASMAKNIKEFENANKLALGETSAAYIDLDESISKYSDGVNALTEEEKKAIQLITQKIGYQQGQDKLYNQLTASILRNHREQKVLNAQTSLQSEKVNQLNQFLVDNGVITKAAAEAEQAKTKAITDQTKATEENKAAQVDGFTVTQQVIEAAKAAASGQGEYKIALDDINKAIDAQEVALRTAINTGQSYGKIQASLTQLYKDQAQAQIDLTSKKEIDNLTSKNITETAIKYSEKLAEVNKRYDEGKLSIGAYEAEKAQIEPILNRITPLLNEEQKAQLALSESLNKLTRAEKENSLQRELSSVTMSNAFEFAKKYKDKLDELGDQLKSNSISLSEYNTKSQLAEGILREVTPLLTDQQQAALGLKSAIDGAGVSTTEFVQKQAKVSKEVKVTAENIRALSKEYGTLESVARNTGASLDAVRAASIAKTRQVSTATKATNLMADAYNKLHTEFDFTSDSTENLKNRLKELSGYIYENNKVSSVWWRGLADSYNEGFKREQQLINETLTLRKYSAQLNDSSISLKQANDIAVGLRYNVRNLDESKLTGIKAQIESVRRSFIELGAAASDAASSVQDRYDELLGNSEDIVKRQFKNELSGLQALYDQATEAGNTQAKKDLTKAMNQLKAIRDAELKEIAKEKAELKNQGSSTNNNDPIDYTSSGAGYSTQSSSNQQQPIGQPQEMRYIVEIKQGGSTTEVGLNSQSDANALLGVLQSMGQVSSQGDN